MYLSNAQFSSRIKNPNVVIAIFFLVKSLSYVYILTLFKATNFLRLIYLSKVMIFKCQKSKVRDAKLPKANGCNFNYC